MCGMDGKIRMMERQGKKGGQEVAPRACREWVGKTRRRLADRPLAATAVVAAPPFADRPTGVGWTERLG